MKRLVLLLACAVLALAACSSAAGAPSPSPSKSGLNDYTGSGPYQGAGLTPPRPRPAFTLTDTSGAAFDFGTATRRHPTLLYFGYTHCPDVCPTTMADVALALGKVPAAVRQKTDVVFVTTDPARDTGPVIAQWLSVFSRGSDAHWVGLTGSVAQSQAAQAAAHVQIAEDDGQTHAADVLLYGADDYARVDFLQSDNESDQIAHDLPLVAG